MKNIYLFIVLLFVSSLAFSQHSVVQNQQLSDVKRIHFGFTLGVNFSDLGIAHTNYLDETNQIYYMEVIDYSPGFTVGIISDLKIFEFLNLRFVPTFNITERKLSFVNQHAEEVNTGQMLRTSMLNFPFYLKYRADRINNYRPYVILGSGLTIDVSPQKGEYILLKSADAIFEIGVGCDIYLPYFKLAPELKFSLGLLDVLERDRSDLLIATNIKYTKALESLTTRMITLTFNFE